MNSRRLRPPETPQGTGATGSGSDGDGVHCGKRCRIQAKPVSQLSARHDSAFAFPSEGKVPEGRMRCRFRLRNRLPAKK